MPRLLPLAFLFAGLLACERLPQGGKSERRSRPCPELPSWAGELPADVFAEVLHLPGEPRAIGFRVYEDGKLETWAQVELVLGADGTLGSRPIEGKWKDEGRVLPERLDLLRQAVRATPPDELAAWSGYRGEGEEATVIRIRRDGQIHQSCYFGDRAPAPLNRIERLVLDLRFGVVPP